MFRLDSRWGSFTTSQRDVLTEKTWSKGKNTATTTYCTILLTVAVADDENIYECLFGTIHQYIGSIVSNAHNKINILCNCEIIRIVVHVTLDITECYIQILKHKL